jgi:trans-aconitate 2-methyltransferase
VTDTWNPAQYGQFRAERDRPFFDLLDLVRPGTAMRVIDLGCGTGELTREMHRRLGARQTLGLDSSAAMLARAAAFEEAGLGFVQGDVAAHEPAAPYDLVFSNAALHWVPDHPRLFERAASWLAEGGQLAVQMPAQHDQPSHVTAEEIAADEPFRSALGERRLGYGAGRPLLSPEGYADLLDRLDFGEQHVRLQVYPHRLASREAVVEWVRGSLLTDYERALGPELFERFLDRYRERLRERLPDRRPFFMGYKRYLIWGRR